MIQILPKSIYVRLIKKRDKISSIAIPHPIRLISGMKVGSISQLIQVQVLGYPIRNHQNRLSLRIRNRKKIKI